MKKGLTELVFILDESGSMADLTADTIGGFNSLIEKKKTEEGEAYVSTVMFSNTSKVVHDRLPLDKVPKLTARDYMPSGCTALLDAVGNAVRHIANIHKYAREEDVPEKTLIIITTDGMENASHKYSYKEIKKLIGKEQEKYGWEFIFLGANIDAAAAADDLGIVRENAVNYHADARGTKTLFGTLGKAVSSMRSCMSLEPEWRAELDEDYSAR
jgi:uncharacterized protein YegL